MRALNFIAFPVLEKRPEIELNACPRGQGFLTPRECRKYSGGEQGLGDNVKDSYARALLNGPRSSTNTAHGLALGSGAKSSATLSIPKGFENSDHDLYAFTSFP